ncbi:hypothetical protein O0H59_12175 [Staphylococcus pseudintermedius]|nr:hypothetical protein [Staphylococcus pseudintermedius]
MANLDRFKDLEDKFKISQSEEEKRLKHNETIRNTPFNITRTTIVLDKALKPLFDKLAFETENTKREFANVLLTEYAKNNYPDIYDQFLNNELKGQKEINAEIQRKLDKKNQL